MRITLEGGMNCRLVCVRERTGLLEYGVKIINARNIPLVQALIKGTGIFDWSSSRHRSFRKTMLASSMRMEDVINEPKNVRASRGV